jgi:hypothetical protein
VPGTGGNFESACAGLGIDEIYQTLEALATMEFTQGGEGLGLTRELGANCVFVGHVG